MKIIILELSLLFLVPTRNIFNRKHANLFLHINFYKMIILVTYIMVKEKVVLYFYI